MTQRITITLDCSDIEIATFLNTLYTIYEHDSGQDKLCSSIMAHSLIRALTFLRDQLGWDSNLLIADFNDNEREIFDNFMNL